MPARAKPAIPSARGLTVDVLESTGGEFIVIGWDISAGPATKAALTRSEQAVLALLLEGKSNAAIATARNSSPRTVANQVASLLKKLNASSRFELLQRFGRSARAP